MALDAYIKFGESTDLGPDGKTYLPLIPGDSDDEDHFWWCELRGCDFQLDAAEHSGRAETDGKDQAKDKPRPQLKAITIKKRVDWSSSALFTKCCEAAEAKNKKVDDTLPDPPGRIKQVTVHVCRQSGENFPFLVIEFKGVVITKYSIDISGPEPVESLTFSAEKHSFRYQQTDRESGGEKGQPHSTGDMDSYTPSESQAGAGQGGPGPISIGAPMAVPVMASSGAAPNGSPASVAVATDGGGSSNFPGLWRENGFGLLPD